MDQFIPDPNAVGCLDESLARQLGAVPIALEQSTGKLHIGLSPDTDLPARDRIEHALPEGISARYDSLHHDQLLAMLDRCYGYSLTLEALLLQSRQPNEAPFARGGKADRSAGDVAAPTASLAVRLVDAMLDDAVSRRASDVHLAPEQRFIRLRLRVDGVLVDRCDIPRNLLSSLVVRIKVLAGMDIAETRRPQDGQFTSFVRGSYCDFRVSSFPVITGENVVIRVLPRLRSSRSLGELAIGQSLTLQLKRWVEQPAGLLVVCGPTGTGKTTTLYALLHERVNESLNIMTLEDPVEHPMSRVRQASIDATRLSYAEGVRALLRQDPDVLLIGEIRDADSCAMALRASMTGHQVLTTVHAADAVAAVDRLLELGAPAALLASQLVGVAAQRLLRMSCPLCRDALDEKRHNCTQCGGSGLYGRRVLIELLSMTEEQADLIKRGASRRDRLGQAQIDGCIPIEQVAATLVGAGSTTQAEVDRVLGVNHTSVV